LIIEVHQPMRLRTYRFSEIGDDNYYYDDYENEYFTRKTSESNYLPLNKILTDSINVYRIKLKLSFLFSGIILDKFELYAPEMIQSIKSLINTGCVRLLSGSYSNSFNPQSGNEEYGRQRILQNSRIKSLFGIHPQVFDKTKLFSSNLNNTGVKLFYRNQNSEYELSNEFSSLYSNESIFSAEKFVAFLNGDHKKNYDTAILFIPYTISGDYQNPWLNEFMKSLPGEIFSKTDYAFADASELADDFRSDLMNRNQNPDIHENFEIFRKSCNDLQKDAFEKLNSLREIIGSCKDPAINKDWLYLQSCDHIYLMDEDIYEGRNLNRVIVPYSSSFLAYINYMNILEDLSVRLARININKIRISKTAMYRWSKVLKKCPVEELPG
jgi:alpha-amylase